MAFTRSIMVMLTGYRDAVDVIFKQIYREGPI
jgi:hypothetical protein